MSDMVKAGRGLTGFSTDTEKFKGYVLSQYKGTGGDGQPIYQKTFVNDEQLKALVEARFNVKWL